MQANWEFYWMILKLLPNIPK